MKLHRCEADRFPDYELYEPTELFDKANVEVPEGLYARYKRALSEYNHVQFEIANLQELSND